MNHNSSSICNALCTGCIYLICKSTYITRVPAKSKGVNHQSLLKQMKSAGKPDTLLKVVPYTASSNQWQAVILRQMATHLSPLLSVLHEQQNPRVFTRGRSRSRSRDRKSTSQGVRMCLRNLGIVWGNYLIIEVAGIPLRIGEHPEHFGCLVNIQLMKCQA